MPKLAIKKRPLSKGSAAPEQPKPLTIEKARETFDLGTIARAIAECRNLNKLRDDARILTNDTNRAKTQAGKALNALILNETIKRGDQIVVGAAAFSYDYAVSDVIPSVDFLALYEQKQITKEVFLKCISVPKDMATKLVGAHILDDLIKPKIGNSADVRIEKLDKPIDLEYKIVKKTPSPPKTRKTQHEPVETRTGSSTRPVRRRIGIRR